MLSSDHNGSLPKAAAPSLQSKHYCSGHTKIGMSFMRLQQSYGTGIRNIKGRKEATELDGITWYGGCQS